MKFNIGDIVSCRSVQGSDYGVGIVVVNSKKGYRVKLDKSPCLNINTFNFGVEELTLISGSGGWHDFEDKINDRMK